MTLISSLSKLPFWARGYMGYYYVLNVYPPNSCVEILTPKVIVFVGGDFGRWTGYEDGALWMGLVPL